MAERPVILVPGWMDDHVMNRLAEACEPVRIANSDPVSIPAALAPLTRGIASAGLMPAVFMDALPALEIVAHYGVGYDAVAWAHAIGKGIMVTNTPDVLNEEVADTAMALLLNTVREMPKAEAFLRNGLWVADDEYPPTRLSLRGRSAGIFGLGRIGRAVAQRISGFGLPVSYHNRRPVEGVPYRYFPSLVELARNVDTLICAAPGGAATRKAIDAAVLAALGPSGVFINIGRGSTVDETALIEALQSRTIAAAGLDVFSDEPNVPQALLGLDNAVLTPHVGSASKQTRRAMADLVASNLLSWFATGRAVTPVPEAVGKIASR